MIDIVQKIGDSMSVIIVTLTALVTAWFTNFLNRKKNKAEVTAKDLVNMRDAQEINQLQLDNVKTSLSAALLDISKFHEREMAYFQQIREANERIFRLENMLTQICTVSNCPNRQKNNNH